MLEKKQIVLITLVVLVVAALVVYFIRPEEQISKSETPTFNDRDLREFGYEIERNVKEYKHSALFKKISLQKIQDELANDYGLSYEQRVEVENGFEGDFRLSRYLIEFIIEDGTFHFMKVIEREGKHFLRFRAYQNFLHEIIDFELDLTGENPSIIGGYSHLLDKSIKEYIKELLFDRWNRDEAGRYNEDENQTAERLLETEIKIRNSVYTGDYLDGFYWLQSIPSEDLDKGYVKRSVIHLLPYLPPKQRQTLITRFQNSASNPISSAIYKSMLSWASENKSEFSNASSELQKLLPKDLTVVSLDALSSYKSGKFEESLKLCDSVLTYFDQFSELRLIRLLASQNLNVTASDTLNNRILSSYDLNDMSKHDFHLATTLSNEF